jgi:RNA polymerase sigma-70 factor (ECF subfamily)
MPTDSAPKGAVEQDATARFRRTNGLPEDEKEGAPKELSDRELIERCLAKGPETESAWEEIVRRYRRKVFGIAYKFTGRYEESQDLTQEIFLRVFRSLDKFDRSADFGTWLYSVSRNHCIDHYRSGRREREVLIPYEHPLEEVASGRFDPHRRIEVMDKREMLLEALGSLPEKLREAVVLRDIKGLSYQEIVERLKLPEGTVKSRINRGRLELGRTLLARKNRAQAGAES